ncbi:ParB/RepB/Spo0J family partition protein (plasmid) [Deinococcus sp. KNUC1210]|uniref:ParB/RepB/Spo0J family partition protein n=1 Tax=Deinococcus sp. KNUC1210 TaxID=2917691 RepID=UPI001EF0E09E|nr:ParB/RepB/Spo0J family partition protein [Deinococcus sp. KNUC1210]ULH16951.1 ParB/RepB/Spo0J family partition protein [Deinococcus sp. KNUC1210]
MEGLTASIKEHGVLQPLLVRRNGTQLLLIAGERRLRAARLANLSEVPVRVFDIAEAAARVLAIIENAQREDVDVISETLLGFELLQEHTGLAEPELLTYLQAVRKGRTEDTHQAEALLRSTYGTGISVWSQRRAAVLRMTPAERQAIRQRQTDVAVCAELVKIKDPGARAAWLQRVIQEQLSAPQLRALLQQPTSSGTNPDLHEQVSTLRRHLGKLERLQGAQAKQAQTLIARLQALIEA